MFESVLLKTDVTAVKFNGNYILAGIGNFLNIFDRHGTFLEKIHIFDGQKIHGIEIDAEKILLYGGSHLYTLTGYNPSELRKLLYKKIEDWILTARWLKNQRFAVIVMLNKLIIFNEDLSKQREVSCGDKCILYSAFICYDFEEIVILSGTVFGEILVWKESDSVVRTRLKEHKGVIFSIDYNSHNGYICSSSDDRSSILWSVSSGCIHKELKCLDPKINLKRKFYGHQSRIFRAMVLDDFLITGGEDSFVNVWNFHGELLRKISTHQGGPVWALDSRSDSIVSGGGDAGILVSPIRDDVFVKKLVMLETPRRIAILASTNLIVITENGTLYYNRRGEWVKIEHFENLKSYNLLEVSKCKKIFSISGLGGEVYLFKEQNDGIEMVLNFNTESSRIYSFHWLTCGTFLICQKGLLSLWYLLTNEALLITVFKLPREDVWTTAACQSINGTYIIGDRRGTIYVYSLGTATPIQIFKKAHNYLGITQLYSSEDNQIVSLGRDGTVKTYIFKNNRLLLISTDKVPFTWLVQLKNGLLFAFSGSSFIVWDYEGRRILFEHVCGGGHRSWDVQNPDDSMIFSYVKDRVINIIKYTKHLFHPLNIVSGYHIATINSIQVLKLRQYIIFSGSEDTSFRISSISTGLPVIRNFKSHLSSIRSVCLHELGVRNYLLVTGGGRGQIICWKCSFGDEKFICSEESSFYEASKEEFLQSEIRVMDMRIAQLNNQLLLFVASSDGNINTFLINEENERFQIHFLRSLFNKTKCVTRVGVLYISDKYLLVSMSTDGNFTFWDVSDVNKSEEIVPFQIIQIHQSGIVGFSFFSIGNDLVVFLTGGDDGSIVLNLFSIISENGGVKIVLLDTFRDFSHCAQVTGTWVSEKYFLTASIDQKVLIFDWCVNNNKFCCQFLARYNSAVADIQGLECVQNGRDFDIFIYGKGVEFVKYKVPN